ncbi:MAG: KH domain-containing protein [Candidatus Bathyarchaeota archaeon]|nr:KH domain-containing protein [Candidatus Bathyarchaeota archaeon]MDH5788786.1 KH domain-containing protein [Candidatus Bathyarchaeota archaeon]
MAKPSSFLRIPKERVGVLIGADGKVKKSIEDKLSVELQIESETGGVTVMLTQKAEDPTLLFKARDIVTAVGRGFSPEHAFKLIRDEDAMLDVIDLRTIFGRSESDLRRIKGRIIGMNGKTRRLIEELTDTNVAVYGHTVSIIGNVEEAKAAREAIQMLVKGSLHSTVYRFLHRKRRELKKKMLEIWEKPPEE